MQKGDASLCIKGCGHIANYFQIDRNTNKPFTSCCSLCNGTINSTNHTSTCNNDNSLTTRGMLAEIILLNSGKVKGQDYHVTIMLLKPGIPNRLVRIIASKIQDLTRSFQSLTLILENNMWGRNSVKIQNSSGFYKLQQEASNIILRSFIDCNFASSISTERYPSGVPPPHININGDINEITRLSGKKFNYFIKLV